MRSKIKEPKNFFSLFATNENSNSCYVPNQLSYSGDNLKAYMVGMKIILDSDKIWNQVVTLMCPRNPKQKKSILFRKIPQIEFEFAILNLVFPTAVGWTEVAAEYLQKD